MIPKRVASVVLSTGLAIALEREASAFNEDTHRRIVEFSVDAMSTRTGTRPATPAGVTEAQWTAFLDQMQNALDELSRLHTGLTGAYKGAYERDTDDARAKPVPIDLIVPGSYEFNVPADCNYHVRVVAPPYTQSREYNLLNAANIPIKDFPYTVEDQYGPCVYKLPAGDRTAGLGEVLGWHAASVDWRELDTSLWARPTNAGVFGLIQEAETRAFETIGGAFAYPFVCLARALQGKGCHFNEAIDVARHVNVLELVEGLVPGIGPFDSDVTTGMWHFIDVDATWNRFNDTRGLFYENAGPGHIPGAFDVGIMAAFDLAGLTIEPYRATGPKRYGKYDRFSRNAVTWESHNVGHTEFSPVSNLATYGWDQFDGTDAAALSWPLHAIGDAAAPQHVAGTTGWGHRPFEDAVDRIRYSLLPRAKDTSFAAIRDRILANAYNRSKGFGTNQSIAEFVIREARVTRDIARADNDWVFDDVASDKYLEPLQHVDSIQGYRDHPARLQPFVEHAVAHTIAFLIRASSRMKPNLPGIDQETLCLPNQYFTGEEPGCANGTAPGTSSQSEPLGVESVSCAGGGGPCTVTGDCCSGLTCSGATSTNYGTCSTIVTPPPDDCGSSAHCPAGNECTGTTACVSGCCKPVDCGLYTHCPSGGGCVGATECRGGCCISTVN